RRRRGHRSRGRTRGAALELVPRAGDLEQLLHGLGGLGALAQPFDGLVVVDVDLGRLGPRRVEPDALDEAPVAGRAGVGGDDAVGRLLLLAHALEAQLDGHLSPRPGPPMSGSCDISSLAPRSPLGPLPSIFIIFWTSLNCFSSWLTSVVVIPLPLAIRRRREPLMICGSRRSSGVMERMMASILAISESSISAFFSSLGIPVS